MKSAAVANSAAVVLMRCSLGITGAAPPETSAGRVAGWSSHRRSEQTARAVIPRPRIRAILGRDDPAFVKRMGGWVKTHRRVELLAWFESRAGSIFDLASKPRIRAILGRDDPAFVKRMGGWVKTHRRVELLAWFESRAGSIFDLASKPRSRA